MIVASGFCCGLIGVKPADVHMLGIVRCFSAPHGCKEWVFVRIDNLNRLPENTLELLICFKLLVLSYRRQQNPYQSDNYLFNEGGFTGHLVEDKIWCVQSPLKRIVPHNINYIATPSCVKTSPVRNEALTSKLRSVKPLNYLSVVHSFTCAAVRCLKKTVITCSESHVRLSK